MKKMELLAPAGNFEQLEAAIIYGADAVYLGGAENSLRSRGFNFQELAQVLNLAHKNNVQVYYCLNAFPLGIIPKETEANIAKLAEYKVDGLIIADSGMFNIAKKYDIPIHISTQANTCNEQSVNFWHSLGATRVNLARELNFKQIKDIIKANPNIEYECFVHGAMCLAISGKCMLSAYLNKRSANLGKCTQPCRFNYKVTALEVEEEKRPNEPVWQIEEENDHSAIWSTNDLCLLPYIKFMQNAGVHTLKIEGRMRTGSYSAQVLRVYRAALDSLYKNEKLDYNEYYKELSHLKHRNFSSGFFLPQEKILMSETNNSNIIAKIQDNIADNKFFINIKASFDNNKAIKILLPKLESIEIQANNYNLENFNGETQSVLHSGVNACLVVNEDIAKKIKTGFYICQ